MRDNNIFALEIYWPIDEQAHLYFLNSKEEAESMGQLILARKELNNSASQEEWLASDLIPVYRRVFVFMVQKISTYFLRL